MREPVYRIPALIHQSVLLKKILDLLEEQASLCIVAVSKRVVKLGKQLLLLACKSCRNLQNKFDDMIASHVRIRVVLVRNTLVPECDRVTRLSTFFEIVLLLAVNSRNFDLTAQSRLCKCYRHVAVCCIAVSFENIMLLDLELDIKIAVRTAVGTGLTFASYREKITIADIPDETNAGDIVSVWPTKTAGKKHIYRIEKVLKEEVILSRLEDGSFKGSYHIPVNGYSVTAPMQYTDITRSLKNPRAGAVFEQIEKEPVSAIRQYQVISVKKEAVPDVFGELSGKRKITECQLIDLDDSSKTVFTVRAVQNNETYGAQMMGEYVSGGILMRSTHEENRLPITFEEALHAGLSAPGDSVKRMVNRTAEMPGWQLVHQALEEQKETLSYGGETWSIRSDGENHPDPGSGISADPCNDSRSCRLAGGRYA